MGELIKQMSTPAWWINVVVVGILVNIFSDYLKIGLDRFLGRFSDKRKRTNERERVLFEKEVQELIDTPSKVTDVKIEILDAELKWTSTVFGYLIISSTNPFPWFDVFSTYIIGSSNTSWFKSIVLNVFNLLLLLFLFANANKQRRLNKIMKEYRKRVVKK
jgi:hypothetical protein